MGNPAAWCWPADDCTLHDYATFLSVTSALNITFFLWWDRIYDHLRVLRERSKDERDQQLEQTDAVHEDDGNRAKCDAFVKCARIVGRSASALVTITVVTILLVFRSNSPMSFAWTASSILVGPMLMGITLGIHWLWLKMIESGEKHFIRGARAVKRTAAEVRDAYRAEDNAERS